MTEKDDSGVLGSLPTTRPARLGGERRGGAKRKPAATKSANGAGAKATRPAARKPRSAKAPAAKATPARGPRAVRAGAPELEAPTERAKQAPEPPPAARPPSGTELVTTAIQAAGELAQIGLTVGGQILKRAAEKLPRP